MQENEKEEISSVLFHVASFLSQRKLTIFSLMLLHILSIEF